MKRLSVSKSSSQLNKKPIETKPIDSKQRKITNLSFINDDISHEKKKIPIKIMGSPKRSQSPRGAAVN